MREGQLARVKGLREMEAMTDDLVNKKLAVRSRLLEVRDRLLEAERTLETSRNRQVELRKELAALEAEKTAYETGWRQSSLKKCWSSRANEMPPVTSFKGEPSPESSGSDCSRARCRGPGCCKTVAGIYRQGGRVFLYAGPPLATPGGRRSNRLDGCRLHPEGWIDCHCQGRCVPFPEAWSIRWHAANAES